MSHPPNDETWLNDLLQAERDAPGPDPETQARLWRRVQASATLVEAGGLTATAVAAATATAGRLIDVPSLGWAVGPIVLGALLIGAVAHVPRRHVPDRQAALDRAEDRVARRKQHLPATKTTMGVAVLAATPTIEPAGVAEPEETAESAKKADNTAAPPTLSTLGVARQHASRGGGAMLKQRHTTRAPPHHVAPRRADGLREELRLVRAARAAIAATEPSRALTLLREHARRFATGQLREERDALQVVALAKSGAHDRASAAASAFLRRYPSSMQTGVVQAAVAVVR